MVQDGPVHVNVNTKNHGVDISFDPECKEQMLSFRISVNVSLRDLLHQLIEAQRHEAVLAQSVPVQVPGQQMQPAGHHGQHAMENVVTHTPPNMHMMPRPPPPPVAEDTEREHAHAVSPPGLIKSGPPGLSEVAAPHQPGLGTVDGTSPLWSAKLLESVQRHDIDKVREALEMKADINFQESHYGRSPLHLAVENCGTVEEVGLLVKAKANVNAAMAQGLTPLHVAIAQYRKLPPPAIGVLLCSGASLDMMDSRSHTPKDLLKQVAGQYRNQPDMSDGWKARQLIALVTDQKMVAFHVENQDIFGTLFADTSNNMMVYNTNSKVFKYSLKQDSIQYSQDFSSSQADVMVQDISVNPEVGTVAAAVCFMQKGKEGEALHQVVTLVCWPNGRLGNEEPLKVRLSDEGGDLAGQMHPYHKQACVRLWRTQGSVPCLYARFFGKVCCWHLNEARSQVLSEVKLADRGGCFAISDNGKCACIHNLETGNVDVWMRVGDSLRHITSLMNKRPSLMSVAMTETPGSQYMQCYVAMVEEPSAEEKLPPIAVTVVGSDGALRLVYNLPQDAACSSLSFRYKSSVHLLSARSHGLVSVYNLESSKNEAIQVFDSPTARSAALSPDGTLMASTEGSHFRIYQVSSVD
eukprot:TRINITY_DN17950_c0_g1_i2.p1 TRINITY_DN17950_c0_g1~~TRINITY_DN17950_c0_g1_i2.p1  ORF type:complete len:636 (-),score=107.94 TRINITY_DN17950_c0_g1_i2:114-2021(-)